jgi:hypothetical protein
MKGVYVYDFGMRNDIQTYRINGSKDDLEMVVQSTLELGTDFEEEPIIEHVRRSEWSMLLKVKVPVKVGANHANQ